MVEEAYMVCEACFCSVKNLLLPRLSNGIKPRLRLKGLYLRYSAHHWVLFNGIKMLREWNLLEKQSAHWNQGMWMEFKGHYCVRGAGSCLPHRKCHYNWLFWQGCSRLCGNIQNLRSCCLCSSLLVNQLSETARLALLTSPSIHKALPPQIGYVFRGKEWPCYVWIYLFIYDASLAMLML